MNYNRKSLLVLISDLNYFGKAQEFIEIILNNNFWIGNIMILTDVKNFNSIPNYNFFLRNNIELKNSSLLINKIKWHKRLPKNVLSPIVTLKLLIFTQSFKSWDSILYIDIDMLVRSKLENLIAICSGKFNAVKNMWNPTIGSQFSFSDDPMLYKQLKKKYNLFNPAFNAGLICIKPKLIDIDVIKDFMDLFLFFGPIAKFGEQSLLNLVFYKKWSQLPSRYNFYSIYNEYYYFPKIFLKCDILHFTGVMKPWDKKSNFFEDWENYKDPSSKKLNFSRVDYKFLTVFRFLSLINPLNVKKNISWFISRYIPTMHNRLKKIKIFIISKFF